MRIARVLCPVDFSEESAHAVQQAIAIAGWYHAGITALHVCHPVSVPVPTLLPPVEGASDAGLGRLRQETAARFRSAVAAGIAVDVVVDVGQPADEILKRATDVAADLIVIGTHGAGGFERLALGSVAEKVLRKAPCAVLTVPPRAQMTSTLPFKRLLCAVDFSEWSLAAVAAASSLAQESGAGLTLLHVLEWPWPEPPPPAFEELPVPQATALLEYRRYLEKSARERLETLGPQSVHLRDGLTSAVCHGKAYVEIVRVAAEQRADLIVMGVHGRNRLDMWLLGSTTNQVVRRAACPVLTLRQ